MNNPRTVDEMVQAIIAADNSIKETFAKAFISETGLSPSECQLVCKDERNGTKVYWFEPKQHKLSDFSKD